MYMGGQSLGNWVGSRTQENSINLSTEEERFLRWEEPQIALDDGNGSGPCGEAKVSKFFKY